MSKGRGGNRCRRSSSVSFGIEDQSADKRSHFKALQTGGLQLLQAFEEYHNVKS